ncbi:tetratricopeptide repeat protein [Altericista sp. CCNU0014]|uniref:tetratricopeptide repeat protein n=1 Tax=Altericista sp. CCNU0014 TaxID=3082949 RepID=UPI00384B3924
MKHHRRSIAVLRWVGSGAMLMGLMGGLGETGMEAGAAAPVMREIQQQLAQAGDSAGQVAFNEGQRLYQQQTAESARAAIVKFEEAVKLFRAAKNSEGEATSLVWAGYVYDALGEKQKALEYYNQALPISRAVGDRAGEATALNNMGGVYDALGEKTKALEYYNQSLPISRAVGDRAGEATALNNMGGVYDALGEKTKALKYYNQALPISRAVGDRAGEARTLNNMGLVYDALGEKTKALEYYNQALPISRAVGDRTREATTLNNIGLVYDALGEKTKALEYYNQALPIIRAVGDRAGEARTLNNMGLVYDALGEKTKALEYYNQALPISRAVGDRAGEAVTLNNIGRVYDDLGEKTKALEYYSQALPISRAVGDRTQEATTLNNMGGVYDALGEKQKALEYYNQALPIIRAVGGRAGEAVTLNNIGRVYDDLGEKTKALEYYNQSLPISRAVDERTQEATTLNNMGGVYDALGEKQKALEYYNQALPISRAVGDRTREATTLNNIGLVYDALGEKTKALEYYNQSLLISRAVGDRAGEARTLNNIGVIYSNLGEKTKALEYYNQALPIIRAVGDRAGEAVTLSNIGLVYDALGEKQKALEYYNQALPISRAVGDRTQEAGTLNNIGGVYDALGEKTKALEYYNQALPIIRAVGDRAGEATILNNIAHVYREQGKLEAALEQINAAIAIIDELRLKISAKELRTSYFSSVQDYYQFKTDLLMQLHQKSPQKGYEKQAFETSDRARARGLIELLTESNITLQPTTANSALFTQERTLHQALRQLEQRRVITLSKDHTPAQAQALDRQSEALLQQRQDLTVKLRTADPAYANLKYPQPLTLSQIQQQVLDKDTLLLQYSLGADQSYLWAVTANGIQTYILPKQATLEAAAKKFRSATANPGSQIIDAKRTGDALYQLILAPVANQLPRKRLLIVADGALQYTPFAALPLPNTPTYTPLLKNHEILNAPSASAIAVLRQQKYTIGPKTLAVIADPVFRSDDGRIAERNANALDACAPALADRNQPKTVIAQNLPRDLQNTLRDLDLRGIQRLPETRKEAEEILALVPPAQNTAACAFAASYGRVTQPKNNPLNQYRIVHFATHGLVNPIQPQFSGLVLSLVDRQGKPQDGFLRLHDIFNLRLAADLVVLSACQTGMGKDIKGEGLVGLTRGFMYAGSRRVVASLWSVADDATAQLMAEFYRSMLQQKQTPAAALRSAQLKMWETKPDPYLWAAFTLQGEWRP